MLVLFKLICKFIVIPIEIQESFLKTTDKLIPRFIWKCRGTRMIKQLKKEYQSWRFHAT